MTRGRPERDPSGRNLEMFHELVCNGRCQRDVARRFGVAQPRVAEVCRQVEAWIELILGGRAVEPDRGLRFHQAIAVRRLQLEEAYGQSLEGVGGREAVARFVRLEDGVERGALPRECIRQLPPRAKLSGAFRVSRELDDLDRLISRGPYRERFAALLATVRQTALAAEPAGAPHGELTGAR